MKPLKTVIVILQLTQLVYKPLTVLRREKEGQIRTERERERERERKKERRDERGRKQQSKSHDSHEINNKSMDEVPVRLLYLFRSS